MFLSDKFNLDVLNIKTAKDGCLEVDEKMLAGKSLEFVDKLEKFSQSGTFKTLKGLGKIAFGFFGL